MRVFSSRAPTSTTQIVGPTNHNPGLIQLSGNQVTVATGSDDSGTLNFFLDFVTGCSVCSVMSYQAGVGLAIRQSGYKFAEVSNGRVCMESLRTRVPRQLRVAAHDQHGEWTML